LRKEFPDGGQLCRMRGADDGTDVAVAACAQFFARPVADCLGHVHEYRPAVADQVLELARAGIARPYQHEDAAAVVAGAVETRLDRIAAHVRIDSQRVRIPDRVQIGGNDDAGKSGVRVGLGGRGDVVALGIEDGEQPALTSATHQPLQCNPAGRTARFKEGTLRLDDWHERPDDVEDARTDLLDRAGNRLERAAAVALANLARQRFPARIEADTERVAPGANSGEQTVSEMRHSWIGAAGGLARAPGGQRRYHF